MDAPGPMTLVGALVKMMGYSGGAAPAAEIPGKEESTSPMCSR